MPEARATMMTPMRGRLPLLLLSILLAAAQPAPAQVPADAGTIIVTTGGESDSPVPTLLKKNQANREIQDLLFLHLADLGRDLSTTNERGFLPRLARSWSRRDPTTLAFELDPRARWQDGRPVTSADVMFALDRARDPKLTPDLAPLLTRIQSVTAEGDHRVVVHFTAPYAEQLYDVVYHAPPLPAHLLAAIPPESLATAPFIAQPVGNGPYRYVRHVQGQLIELAADPGFFLGAPRIRRVVVLVVRDAETRASMLLSGAADAVDNIYALPNPARLERLPEFRYYPLPGLTVLYAVFGARDRADSTRPHPLFADAAVRRALVESVDRLALARLAYGALSTSPSAPVSAILARAVDAPPALPYDTAAARRLLAQRGWADHDGDGVLDKNGVPFSFSIMLPAGVPARLLMATRMQEGWRQLGINAQLDLVDRAVFLSRRSAGDFDLEMDGVIQDPTPSGLTQSWSCGGIGGANIARYCNRRVDSLLAAAPTARGGPLHPWREAVRLIAEDVPAIFLAAPVGFPMVHRRFNDVTVRPESVWSTVWQWSVRPGQQIDRDRQ